MHQIVLVVYHNTIELPIVEDNVPLFFAFVIVNGKSRHAKIHEGLFPPLVV
jgi:hypothetical protein